MRFLSFGAFPLAVAIAACSGADASLMIRARAARDLVCTESTIRLEHRMDGSYDAIGCGKRAAYRAVCEGMRCEVHPGQGP